MKTVENIPLNEIQISLLRMFSRPMTEEQTLKIKRALVRFLTEELDDEIEKVVKEKNITDQDFDKLRNQNQRTATIK
ncbi:hypothetical protein P1X15_18040 [Runella sp. MFBS21]|uniref:hypothetical protein n=1 Tax=Runella sp. MFBS21 TaxID=3034018 RepID=UPI0023F7CEE8|nr:hypothetical protein [Runella sp. MFBS21]MDF7819525.1 hypothetical protein [Runella sp. MFBS21]